ncbi:major facilitator superfamily transporter [Nitzschia inconspicua]|uniref:Major facilitator superfamily transporter n=1 Tax=Nitzschia inconspicua TaxID=303405 RepID=A0A9K3KXN6_9STRA|nr:major facilitator superfamily transporter [Nitzschia inconspicua]
MYCRRKHASTALLVILAVDSTPPISTVEAFCTVHKGNAVVHRAKVAFDGINDKERQNQKEPLLSRLFLQASDVDHNKLSRNFAPILKSTVPVIDNVSPVAKKPGLLRTAVSTVRTHFRRKAEMRKRQCLYLELQTVETLHSPGTQKSIESSSSNISGSAASTAATSTTAADDRISRMDVALFVTYFCNMAVLTLSVVTVPALAMDHFNTPHAATAFVAGVASMAPFGGGIGKLVNGFVCQRLGGRQASWLYMTAMSALCLAMSFTKSLAPVGLFLVGFDFLSSIQWTSICDVLDQHYRRNPQLMARGIALLSLSSTLGALAAKTIGAVLMQATHWRTVCRIGSLAALLGAAAMHLGVREGKDFTASHSSNSVAVVTTTCGMGNQQSPLASLKSILGNKLFWMIGIGHSLGYLARGSDRLLGPFFQEAASLSSSMAAGLTSSVTIGFVVGLIQGRVFSQVDSVKLRMKMIRQNYVVAIVSVLGLAVCGLNRVTQTFQIPSGLVAAGIALCSGIMAGTVSFQFYQFPNLVSANVFPDNSAVSLSLLDAAGFFMTAQVLTANNHVLRHFGWSASWTFLAMIFGLGGTVMSKGIQPVLMQARRNQRKHGAATDG